MSLMVLVPLMGGCSAPSKAPNLGGIYNHLAQHEDPYRNPVILTPGLLGFKLVDPDSEIENRHSRLVSPIPWTDVMFLFSSHQNITNDPFFMDNLLYILLEKPRKIEY